MNWNINTLGVVPQEGDLTNVVITAEWQCVAEQDGFTARSYGSSSFKAPSSEDFTPFDQLTQDQVLDWVWTVGGISKADVEANLQAQIDAQINPPVIYPPLPWAAQ